MKDNGSAQSFEPTHEFSPLEPEILKSAILRDVADVDRLTCSSGLNPIIKHALNKIASSLRRRVSFLLSPPSSSQSGTRRISYMGTEELPSLDDAKLDKLIECFGLEKTMDTQKEIHCMIDAILHDVRYLRAVEAYHQQDEDAQQKGSLYRFLSNFGFAEVYSRYLKLYSGVNIAMPSDVLTSPDETMEIVHHVQKHGLVAQKSRENLPGLESVLLHTNLSSVVEPLVLEVTRPENDKLWIRGADRELDTFLHQAQVVNSTLCVPFIPVLRSPRYYHKVRAEHDKNGGQVLLSDDEYRSYIKEIRARLTSANLQYQIYDLRGHEPHDSGLNA